MSACRYSAFRISTRCCSPTDNSPTIASGSTSSSYSCSSRRSSARAFASDGRSNGPLSAPSTMFSSTVNGSTSMKCWWTMPIPARIAARLSGIRVASPLIRISPASAV